MTIAKAYLRGIITETEILEAIQNKPAIKRLEKKIRDHEDKMDSFYACHPAD